MMPESLCVVPWEPGQTLAEARQYVRPRWWGLYEDRRRGVKRESAFFSAVQHFFSESGPAVSSISLCSLESDSCKLLYNNVRPLNPGATIVGVKSMDA